MTRRDIRANRCYVDDPSHVPICGHCGGKFGAQHSTFLQTYSEGLQYGDDGLPLAPPPAPRWWRRLLGEIGRLLVQGSFRSRRERAAERHRYAEAHKVFHALYDQQRRHIDCLAHERTEAAKRERLLQEERLREEAERLQQIREREEAARQAEAARQEGDQERREAEWRASERGRLYGELDQLRYMDGLTFEKFLARCFWAVGMHADVTQGSGDFGVDLVVRTTHRKLIAVQAKNVSGSVGNTDVQKLDSGRRIHHCVGALMICTSSCYTRPARKAAKKLDVTICGECCGTRTGRSSGERPPPEADNCRLESLRHNEITQ